jgi:VWFA-related protein
VLVDLTSDHSVVAAKLRAFLPSAQSLNEAQQEERRYRQQFAAVHNPADLNTVNGSRADLPDAEQSIDPELMSLGSNPARASLIILAQVARHLAAIPGHKTLVWISSDNVLAGSRDQAAGADKDANTIEGIALRAREGMNDAHASVYPVDVSQWQGGVASDSQHSSMDLAAAAAQAAASAASAGAAGASGSARDSSRDTGVGSVSAQMTQDLHPIQGAVREVADGTGGRAIQRAADLAAALSGIVQDGRAAYELSFSPQTAADDRYHTITVKLTGRHGVTLRYRTGYVFDKEPATLKGRFQQAVWRPADTSGIGVTAGVAPGAGGNSLSVKIAGSDLAMEQQGGRWMDKLDIFFVQRDDVGIRAHLDGQTLGLRLKPETYQNAIGSGIPIEHTVQMQPGMTSVRVLVVDENSGRMGSVTIPSSALQAAR